MGTVENLKMEVRDLDPKEHRGWLEVRDSQGTVFSEFLPWGEILLRAKDIHTIYERGYLAGRKSALEVLRALFLHPENVRATVPPSAEEEQEDWLEAQRLQAEEEAFYTRHFHFILLGYWHKAVAQVLEEIRLRRGWELLPHLKGASELRRFLREALEGQHQKEVADVLSRLAEAKASASGHEDEELLLFAHSWLEALTDLNAFLPTRFGLGAELWRLWGRVSPKITRQERSGQEED